MEIAFEIKGVRERERKNRNHKDKQPHFVCCVCVRVFKTRKILFPILQLLFEKLFLSVEMPLAPGSFSMGDYGHRQMNAMQCKMPSEK